MEKYKSEFIKEEDLKIYTSQRTKDGEVISRIVEVQHIPTGFYASAEDKTQLVAYKKAIKILENRVIGEFMDSIIK